MYFREYIIIYSCKKRKLNRINSNKIFANKWAGCKSDGSRVYMNLSLGKHIIPILEGVYTRTRFSKIMPPSSSFSMISFSQRIENAQEFLHKGEWFVSSDWSCRKVRQTELSKKQDLWKREKSSERGVRKRNKREVKIMFAVVISFPTHVYYMRKKKVRKEGKKWK